MVMKKFNFVAVRLINKKSCIIPPFGVRNNYPEENLFWVELSYNYNMRRDSIFYYLFQIYPTIPFELLYILKS